MKNRMRETCTFGSVRGGGGNAPTYSASGFDDGTWFSSGRMKLIEPGISIGLEDPAVVSQMLLRVLSGSVRRVKEQGRWRCRSGERSIIANIGPQSSGDRSAFGQHRNRGVIAMQSFCHHHMQPSQRDQWREECGARTDPVSQRRHIEVDPFASINLALPVQWLICANFASRIIASRFGLARPRAIGWNGAGGWVTVSQARQVNFSRTVWITFQRRGITSRVSVMLSPSLASLPPQHGQAVGPGITTRSRGK